MTHPSTLKEAVEQLDGKTKSQVAKKLRDAKIKGDKFSAHNCPIAVYLLYQVTPNI
jgi:hypothetical protein